MTARFHAGPRCFVRGFIAVAVVAAVLASSDRSVGATPDAALPSAIPSDAAIAPPSASEVSSPKRFSLAQFADSSSQCPTERKFCFGLRVHLGFADEEIPVTPDWLVASIAFANQMFAPIDVGFELAEVCLASKLPAVIDGMAARDAVAKSVKRSTVIDIFVVGSLIDLDKPHGGLFGVHWRQRGKRSRRVIMLSSVAWPRTLAHELGHFFSLPHSTYAISIMNKTPRLDPPMEERRFADEEIGKLRSGLKAIVAAKELVSRKKRDGK